jgi:hypothetical protein
MHLNLRIFFLQLSLLLLGTGSFLTSRAQVPGTLRLGLQLYPAYQGLSADFGQTNSLRGEGGGFGVAARLEASWFFTEKLGVASGLGFSSLSTQIIATDFVTIQEVNPADSRYYLAGNEPTDGIAYTRLDTANGTESLQATFVDIPLLLQYRHALGGWQLYGSGGFVLSLGGSYTARSTDARTHFGAQDFAYKPGSDIDLYDVGGMGFDRDVPTAGSGRNLGFRSSRIALQLGGGVAKSLGEKLEVNLGFALIQSLSNLANPQEILPRNEASPVFRSVADAAQRLGSTRIGGQVGLSYLLSGKGGAASLSLYKFMEVMGDEIAKGLELPRDRISIFPSEIRIRIPEDKRLKNKGGPLPPADQSFYTRALQLPADRSQASAQRLANAILSDIEVLDKQEVAVDRNAVLSLPAYSRRVAGLLEQQLRTEGISFNAVSGLVRIPKPLGKDIRLPEAPGDDWKGPVFQLQLGRPRRLTEGAAQDAVADLLSRVKVVSLPTFDLFYLDMSRTRSELKNSDPGAIQDLLAQRFQAIRNSGQGDEFFAYLSNGNSSLEITEQDDFNNFLRSVASIQPDPPNGQNDREHLLESMELDELPPHRRIQTYHFFLSKTIFSLSAQELIVDLIKARGEGAENIRLKIYTEFPVDEGDQLQGVEAEYIHLQK